MLESLVYDPLESVSEIGLIVLNRTPIILVIIFFLSTGINLFITKLLLFPTFLIGI